MKKKNNNLMPYVFLLFFIVLCMVVVNLKGNTVHELNASEFMTALEDSKISEMTIINKVRSENYEISGKLKEYGDNEVFKLYIPVSEEFMKKILAAEEKQNFKLTVEKDSDTSSWYVVLEYVPMLLLAGAMLWLFTRQLGSGGKSMDFGRSKAVLVDGEKTATFKDVAGLTEEKQEVQELIDFLKNPKKFQSMGARIPKGILLVGPPGTGKTLLAKAVAGEAKVPFYYISGSDFVELFVGIGASRVRDMFKQAKMNAPCLIFIDEIDAVGRQRGAGLGGGHDEREQTLNQLLVEMDGFAPNEGVIVLAATNRPDVLDKALLRAGRFDRQIVVAPPDVKAREQILKVHAKKKKMAEDVDLGTIAKNTAGFVGADLENILNEAALVAAKRDEKEITMKDIEDAMIKVTMGPEKKSKVISSKERKLVAFHEAGHAVVSKFLPTQDPVHQISIVPRGMAGGYTMYRPTEDKSFMSKTEMEENIVSLLGGRVAEQLVLGDISTGASNDIERASKIARDMVTKYGMSSKIGTITFGTGQEEVFLGRDFGHTQNYSEATSSEIDTEVKAIIDKAYRTAEQILNMNMDKLTKVANILIEKEKIEGDEFDAIFNS